jgi:thiol-disulfide isomerase/thioredoxin|tara:strand:+ start:579 stop:1160 length:582 start_codon:yes stop_codon:yes gene_type:complete
MLKLILIALFLVSCSKPAELKISDSNISNLEETDDGFSPSECGYSVGDIACDFELLDSAGGFTHLYDFKDSVIVLDFSTAWCYYCQQAAIDVQTIQDANASQGFIYITILVEGFDRQPPTEELLNEWANHFSITSAPVLGADQTILDPMTQNGWFVEAWPTFYYIDRDMRIVQYQKGFSATGLNAMIETLLKN